jgi:hypothetical protein
VQYVRQSKRVFYSLVMLSIAFGVDLSQSSDSVAQIPVDYVCYIQTSDGRTIDLGKLCGSSGRGRPIALEPNDQAFLNSYQRSLSKRLNSPHPMPCLAFSEIPKPLSNVRAGYVMRSVRECRSTCCNLKAMLKLMHLTLWLLNITA